MRFSQRLIALLVLGASGAAAQGVVIPGDTLPPPPAQAPAASLPFEFSGVLYLSFQSGGTRTERLVSRQNRFDIDRAYLNFRAPAGDRMSMRITLDVVQQRDSTRDQFYRGWAFRAKYAYAQYDYIPGAANELKAVARFGMLQTPIIELEESFWPRGIASTAVEQTGFFSSADVGASSLVTLPSKLGEAYVTILNGSGYSSRETDRFKDYGGRLTLTPLMNGHSFLRTLSVTPWYYKGFRGSDFVRKRGTVNAVGEGQQKDRYGLHLGIKDPRLTLAGQFAWKKDVAETADTTRDLVPTATLRTGRTFSAYAIVKPLTFFEALPAWPIQALVRVDNVTANVDAAPKHTFVIAGLGYDLNKKSTIWAMYHNQDPKNGSTAADLKTFMIQAIVNF